MKITQEWLNKHNACSDACQWVAEQEVTDEIELIKAAMKINKSNWVNWYLIQRFTGEKRLRYAIFAAKEVLWIFEKKYPENKAPRMAIEVAENYLKLPSADTARAARIATDAIAYTTDTSYAARAAWAVAHAAFAAAYAADATYTATNSAHDIDTAYAAYITAYAANSACAAYTADVADFRNKIIQYGIALLKKREQ